MFTSIYNSKKKKETLQVTAVGQSDILFNKSVQYCKLYIANTNQSTCNTGSNIT